MWYSAVLLRGGPLAHFPVQFLDGGRGTGLEQRWDDGMHQGGQACTEEQQCKAQGNASVGKVTLIH